MSRPDKSLEYESGAEAFVFGAFFIIVPSVFVGLLIYIVEAFDTPGGAVGMFLFVCVSGFAAAYIREWRLLRRDGYYD